MVSLRGLRTIVRNSNIVLFSFIFSFFLARKGITRITHCTAVCVWYLHGSGRGWGKAGIGIGIGVRVSESVTGRLADWPD